MPVHASHSATVPVMREDSATDATMQPPWRTCVRSHGSKGAPSGRVQAA